MNFTGSSVVTENWNLSYNALIWYAEWGRHKMRTKLRLWMAWEMDAMGIDQCSAVDFGISSTELKGCSVYVFNYFVKATEKWRNKNFYNSSDNISDYMTTGYMRHIWNILFNEKLWTAHVTRNEMGSACKWRTGRKENSDNLFLRTKQFSFDRLRKSGKYYDSSWLSSCKISPQLTHKRQVINTTHYLAVWWNYIMTLGSTSKTSQH